MLQDRKYDDSVRQKTVFENIIITCNTITVIHIINKNATEVDIAPALGKIINKNSAKVDIAPASGKVNRP